MSLDVDAPDKVADVLTTVASISKVLRISRPLGKIARSR